MNKTKIENFHFSVNPVVGCSNALNCDTYCYAKKIARRFPGAFYGGDMAAAEAFQPRLVQSVIDRGFIPPGNHDRPQRISVSSMGDLFCSGVPDEWIERVFDKCLENQRDQFFFLTKNPARYNSPFVVDYLASTCNPKWHFGTSIDCLDHGILESRLPELFRLHSLTGARIWLSVEPLLGDLSGPQFDSMDSMEPSKYVRSPLSWVVVGGQTNPTRYPPEGSVQRLIAHARKWSTPIWIKDNAGYPNAPKEEPKQ